MMRYSTLIYFLLFFLFTAAPAAESSARETTATNSAELLNQANDFFRRAGETADPVEAEDLYRKALLRYENLGREITSGKLYYNIANVYFRLNDLGRAIVNYRRAARFITDDPNLRQNLAVALGKRLDKIEPAQEDQLWRTIFFWHYDLSHELRLLLFAGAYLVFWIIATLYFATRVKIPRWPLALFLVFSLSLGASLLLEGNRTKVRGAIITAEIVARKGDSTSYQPSFEEPLHAGTEFTVLGERASWLHIELADGRQCWIPGQAAELV